MRWLSVLLLISGTGLLAQDGDSPTTRVPGLSRAWVCGSESVALKGLQVNIERFCWKGRNFSKLTKKRVRDVELAEVLTDPLPEKGWPEFWMVTLLWRYSIGDRAFGYWYKAEMAYNHLTFEEYGESFLIRHPECRPPMKPGLDPEACNYQWGALSGALSVFVYDKDGDGQFEAQDHGIQVPAWVALYAKEHPPSAPSGKGQEEPWFDGDEVALEGVLTRLVAASTSEDGESQPESHPALQVRKPVEIACEGDLDLCTPLSGTPMIQLSFFGEEQIKLFDSLAGKPVLVTGTLYMKTETYHHTPFLVSVKEITPK